MSSVMAMPQVCATTRVRSPSSGQLAPLPAPARDDVLEPSTLLRIKLRPMANPWSDGLPYPQDGSPALTRVSGASADAALSYGTPRRRPCFAPRCKAPHRRHDATRVLGKRRRGAGGFVEWSRTAWEKPEDSFICSPSYRRIQLRRGHGLRRRWRAGDAEAAEAAVVGRSRRSAPNRVFPPGLVARSQCVRCASLSPRLPASSFLAHSGVQDYRMLSNLIVIILRSCAHALAVVTVGGICPGLNDIVRCITIMLEKYGVPDIRGIKFGLRGFYEGEAPIKLTRDVVERIHEAGGTFLGTTRGGGDVPKMQVGGLCRCRSHLVDVVPSFADATPSSA